MANGDPQQGQGDPTDVTSIPRTPKERVLSGIGGAVAGALAPVGGQPYQGSGLQQRLQQHYNQRLDEARMHIKNASTYAAILATNKNPETGQPLTPEERTRYENWYNAAEESYKKIAGVDKETKAAVEKNSQIARHYIQQGAAGGTGDASVDASPGAATAGSGGGGSAGSAQSALPPPPGPGTTTLPGSKADAGKPIASPIPPGTTGGPGPQPLGGKLAPPPAAQYDRQAQLAAPALRQQMDDRRALDLHTAQAKATSEAQSDAWIKEEHAAEEMKQLTPQKIADRKAAAKAIGLEPDSPEYTYFLATGSMSPSVFSAGKTAKRFTYVDAQDGKTKFGFQIGNKLVDDQLNPLPPGTEAKEVAPPGGGDTVTTSRRNTHVVMRDGSIAEIPETTVTTKTKLPPPPKGGAAATGATDAGAGPRKPSQAKPKPSASSGAPRIIPGSGKPPAGVVKAYDTYNQSQERYNVMQSSLKAVQEAAKKGGTDQQAMLNLLANHLGMTQGLQKGARITQAMIDEAQKSAPWLQRMQARFDKDGYLTGVVLTPEQMDQMVALAKVRVGEDKDAWGREVKEAKSGYGMGGPDATPPAPKPSSKLAAPPGAQPQTWEQLKAAAANATAP